MMRLTVACVLGLLLALFLQANALCSEASSCVECLMQSNTLKKCEWCPSKSLASSDKALLDAASGLCREEAEQAPDATLSKATCAVPGPSPLNKGAYYQFNGWARSHAAFSISQSDAAPASFRPVAREVEETCKNAERVVEFGSVSEKEMATIGVSDVNKFKQSGPTLQRLGAALVLLNSFRSKYPNEFALKGFTADFGADITADLLSATISVVKDVGMQALNSAVPGLGSALDLAVTGAQQLAGPVLEYLQKMPSFYRDDLLALMIHGQNAPVAGVGLSDLTFGHLWTAYNQVLQKIRIARVFLMTEKMKEAKKTTAQIKDTLQAFGLAKLVETAAFQAYLKKPGLKAMETVNAELMVGVGKVVQDALDSIKSSLGEAGVGLPFVDAALKIGVAGVEALASQAEHATRRALTAEEQNFFRLESDDYGELVGVLSAECMYTLTSLDASTRTNIARKLNNHVGMKIGKGALYATLTALSAGIALAGIVPAEAAVTGGLNAAYSKNMADRAYLLTLYYFAFETAEWGYLSADKNGPFAMAAAGPAGYGQGGLGSIFCTLHQDTNTKANDNGDDDDDSEVVSGCKPGYTCQTEFAFHPFDKDSVDLRRGVCVPALLPVQKVDTPCSVGLHCASGYCLQTQQDVDGRYVRGDQNLPADAKTGEEKAKMFFDRVGRRLASDLGLSQIEKAVTIANLAKMGGTCKLLFAKNPLDPSSSSSSSESEPEAKTEDAPAPAPTPVIRAVGSAGVVSGSSSPAPIAPPTPSVASDDGDSSSTTPPPTPAPVPRPRLPARRRDAVDDTPVPSTPAPTPTPPPPPIKIPALPPRGPARRRDSADLIETRAQALVHTLTGASSSSSSDSDSDAAASDWTTSPCVRTLFRSWACSASVLADAPASTTASSAASIERRFNADARRAQAEEHAKPKSTEKTAKRYALTLDDLLSEPLSGHHADETLLRGSQDDTMMGNKRHRRRLAQESEQRELSEKAEQSALEAWRDQLLAAFAKTDSLDDILATFKDMLQTQQEKGTRVSPRRVALLFDLLANPSTTFPPTKFWGAMRYATALVSSTVADWVGKLLEMTKLQGDDAQLKGCEVLLYIREQAQALRERVDARVVASLLRNAATGVCARKLAQTQKEEARAISYESRGFGCSYRAASARDHCWKYTDDRKSNWCWTGVRCSKGDECAKPQPCEDERNHQCAYNSDWARHFCQKRASPADKWCWTDYRCTGMQSADCAEVDSARIKCYETMDWGCSHQSCWKTCKPGASRKDKFCSTQSDVSCVDAYHDCAGGRGAACSDPNDCKGVVGYDELVDQQIAEEDAKQEAIDKASIASMDLSRSEKRIKKEFAAARARRDQN